LSASTELVPKIVAGDKNMIGLGTQSESACDVPCTAVISSAGRDAFRVDFALVVITVEIGGILMPFLGRCLPLNR